MKKLFVVLAVVAVLALAFAGCEPQQLDVINDALQQVAQARRIQTVTSVSDGELLIAQTQKTYVKTESGITLTTVTKTLNTLPADEQYSVTTTTENLSGGFEAITLSEENFSALTVKNNALSATLTQAGALAQFNVETAADAKLGIATANGRASEITISYAALSGNSVEISVTIHYEAQ